MKKFKQLNQYEYLGLVTLLEKAFPWIAEQTVGTCYNNLKEIQNTITENSPNDKFCMLGAFGLTEGHDIILQFYDYKEENESKLYYITFRDAKDYDSLGYEPFNCLLKNYQL
tara:strand:- start:74 stop:409 length:336 start_codon:yes stop_codon:yes gene_type:complete